MAEQPDIVPASVADAAELLELQKAAFLQEAVLYNEFTMGPLVETFADIEKELKQSAVCFKALDSDRIVGSVRAVQDGECYIVRRLMVLPEYQNKGLGRRLMRALEDHFPNAHCFRLFTGSKSTGNIHLYETLGYKQFKLEKISDRLTFVHMEKFV